MNKHLTNDVKDVLAHYTILHIDADEFLSDFDKEHCQFVMDGNIISTRPIECNKTHLLDCYGLDGIEHYEFIKDMKKLSDIKRDIIEYKKYVKNLIYDYDVIKKRIGAKLLKQDNEHLKSLFLETHKKLDCLKNKYVWIL